jgi:hypothetical protein
MSWALPTKSPEYSYQRGEDVFLEEDCDLSTFARAMTKAGRPFDLIQVNEPRHRRKLGAVALVL